MTADHCLENMAEAYSATVEIGLEHPQRARLGHDRTGVTIIP